MLWEAISLFAAGAVTGVSLTLTAVRVRQARPKITIEAEETHR